MPSRRGVSPSRKPDTAVATTPAVLPSRRQDLVLKALQQLESNMPFDPVFCKRIYSIGFLMLVAIACYGYQCPPFDQLQRSLQQAREGSGMISSQAVMAYQEEIELAQWCLMKTVFLFMLVLFPTLIACVESNSDELEWRNRDALTKVKQALDQFDIKYQDKSLTAWEGVTLLKKLYDAIKLSDAGGHAFLAGASLSNNSIKTGASKPPIYTFFQRDYDRVCAENILDYARGYDTRSIAGGGVRG